MDVGQIDSNTWAISARGFNEEFSTKLLVLLDGRSVYTPTFAGVFWDALDLPLENIERIEVIRGPGGSIWGANAVNGVINIISKKSSDTLGGLVVAGGGNVDKGFGTLQYGSALGNAAEGRAYLKYFNQADLPSLTDQPGSDGWHMLRGGFRIDKSLSSKNNLTVQGDLYGGREGEEVVAFGGGATGITGSLGGGYFQTVWNHTYGTGANSTLQVSYDRNVRNIPFHDDRGSLDAAFQYQYDWGSRQDIVWGGEYRFTDHRSNSASVTYDPSDNVRQLFSAFVQDEIALDPNRVYLTVGLRLEHNEYTGLVALPDARLAWQPTPHQTLWAAVSSAKRTPASGDFADQVTGAVLPGSGGVPISLALEGNPNFQNERLLAEQAGYRASPLPNARFSRIFQLVRRPANHRAADAISSSHSAATHTDSAVSVSQ
jgi:iron complex outermembrane receptor protein